MAEQDGPRGDARDVAREQRLQALSELARQRAQSPSPTPAATSAPAAPSAATHSAKSARRGRLLAILGVVALVAVVGAGTFAYLRPRPNITHQPTVPSQLVLDFDAQHLGCAQDTAWSPDGARLAVLGYTDRCPVPFPLGYVYAAGLVNIYPSQTGKTPLQIQPDDLINSVLHLPMSQNLSSPTSTQASAVKTVIQYSRLLWSRDGQRLALPFLVEEISNAHATADGGTTWDDTRVTGVLLMAADGSHPRVVSHTLSVDGPSWGQWDLSTGTYTSGSSLNSGPYGNLPPALAYAWDANGHLQPQTPLTGTTPPPAPPLAPIGDPAGDASFTIWQPAAIEPLLVGYDTSPTSGMFTLPATYSYHSNLTAWSSDGRYLWISLPTGTYLRDPNQPGPTADQLALAKQWHVDGPWLPVRDKALSAVLAANPPDSLYHLSVSTTSFAWSPDGKRLAAIHIQPDDSGSHVIVPGQYVVDIYDCATGKKLATLTPALRIASSPYSMSTTLLRWSHDGSRLLIYDTVLDEATIWGPGKLPTK